MTPRKFHDDISNNSRIVALTNKQIGGAYTTENNSTVATRLQRRWLWYNKLVVRSWFTVLVWCWHYEVGYSWFTWPACDIPRQPTRHHSRAQPSFYPLISFTPPPSLTRDELCKCHEEAWAWRMEMKIALTDRQRERERERELTVITTVYIGLNLCRNLTDIVIVKLN